MMYLAGKKGTRKNAPGKNAPRKIRPPPQENYPPGKLSPMKFLCEFFLISSFYFYDNFRP